MDTATTREIGHKSAVTDPLLASRARPRRATQAHPQPLRPTSGRTTGAIVAVKPRPAFAPYFKALDENRRKPPKADRKRGMTKRERRGSSPRLSPRGSRSGYRTSSHMGVAHLGS